jgi:hypothetical protein
MATKTVYEVKSVDVQLDKSKPPGVRVKAKGAVRTTGWTQARLAPVIYIQPPPDGIQDLTFLADGPTGPVHETITEIESAVLDLGRVPEWMRGVRVTAETNKMEKLF